MCFRGTISSSMATVSSKRGVPNRLKRGYWFILENLTYSKGFCGKEASGKAPVCCLARIWQEGVPFHRDIGIEVRPRFFSLDFFFEGVGRSREGGGVPFHLAIRSQNLSVWGYRFIRPSSQQGFGCSGRHGCFAGMYSEATGDTFKLQLGIYGLYFLQSGKKLLLKVLWVGVVGA